MQMTHWFAWKNNPRRAELRGQKCRPLVRGKMGSVLVQWENGTRDIVDWQALRRIK